LDDIIVYMILSETCAPLESMERKIDERNVLIVESNSLKSIRLSKNNSELEKKLAKEYYDYLNYKLSICDKEIYRVFYEELPADSTDRAEILENIETEGVQLWTYKSDVPVKPNTLTMNAEAYKALSYREKVERKIAEHNILNAGITNIAIRRNAKEITDYEIALLKEREYELKGLILTCIKEIWNFDWDVIPNDAPDRKGLNDEIKSMNITQARYNSIYNSMKSLRQNHV
jgi:hypothetical protein